MKKILVFVLFIVTLFSACTKDDTSSVNGNQFKYQGMDFKLGNNGVITNQGNGNYLLELYSSSISYVEDSLRLMGIGDILQFTIVSPQADLTGNFEYDPSNTSENVLYSGYVYLNVDAEGSEGYIGEVYEGDIDISYNDNSGLYTVKIDVVITYGVSVKGEFKGYIQPISK